MLKSRSADRATDQAAGAGCATAVRRLRAQSGQAIVLVALMMMAMLAGAGLAIDAQLSFFYASAAERAAAAGALSGVVFLPYSFSAAQAVPPGSGNDARSEERRVG